MSALGFQTVLAHLVRFPDEGLDGIERSLGGIDLTKDEREKLRVMAGNPLVRKFGRKMAYCRQRDATEVMRLSKPFLKPTVLDTMFQDYFEPTRKTSDIIMIGVEFLEFVLSDPRSRRLIAQGEPFLEDLLVYDHARAFVVRQVIRTPDPSLKQGSLLRHSAFLVRDFRFDIPSIDRAKVKNPELNPAPIEKPMKLLFLRCEEIPYYRIFQIDESIEGFLMAQRREPATWREPLPRALPAMAAIGLCRKP